MRIQVIEGVAMTPDFSIAGTVLYQWSKAAVDDAESQARR
jgi:hypothetical protein